MSDVFVRWKTRLGVLDVMTLKLKFYLSSSCWWRKKWTVRRHILEFSEVWTPWALSIGWKSREGSMRAMDYKGNDKRKEWMKEVEECQQLKLKGKLQKTEERIGKSQRKMPRTNFLKAYVTTSWNFKEKNFMIQCTWRQGWKVKNVIQNTSIENSQGNVTVHLREVLKIWENYISELYDRNHRP